MCGCVFSEYLADRERDENLTKAKAAAAQIAELGKGMWNSTLLIDQVAAEQGKVGEKISKLREDEIKARQAAAELDRKGGGWDTIRVWEETLSLGEQQRLAMARFFFRSPRFGVLDECTSAVSVDVEHKLYRAAVEAGITCVTISQRLALAQFHSTELKMGLPTDTGWSLTNISDDARQREENYMKGAPLESQADRTARLAA